MDRQHYSRPDPASEQSLRSNAESRQASIDTVAVTHSNKFRNRGRVLMEDVLEILTDRDWS